MLLAYAPRWQFSSLEDDDIKDVTIESSPGHSSMPRVIENPGSNARTRVSLVSSDGSDIQQATGSLETSANEEYTELETADKLEWKGEHGKDCNSKFDDANASAVLESTATEQSQNDGGTYADEHGYENNDVKKVDDYEDSEATALRRDRTVEENRNKGPFDNIRIMLNDLKLEDHMYRFEDNVIRDTVLEADKDILKDILKEASFPAGVIYEILLYLEKSEGHQSPFKEAGSGRSTSSQYRYRSSVPHAKQKDVHLGGMKFPKKRLLGIGRGGASIDNRHRPAIKPRAAPWKNDKEFGSQRKSSADEGQQLHIRGPAGRGHALALGNERNSNLTKDSVGVSASPTQSNEGNLQEARQIGKVEPIQRTAVSEPDAVKSERGETALLRGSGFGSGSRVCLKCGNKDHTSYECTDVKSILI